jgi:hypothetical protein
VLRKSTASADSQSVEKPLHSFDWKRALKKRAQKLIGVSRANPRTLSRAQSAH